MNRAKNNFKKLLKQKSFAFLGQLQEIFPTCEIFIVGGAVRDALLKKKSVKDIDFVIRNVKARRLEIELARLGRVNLVGKNFGVFKFLPREADSSFEAHDIALPRTEHSRHMTGGYRDFDVQSDPDLPLADDLSRRDFTINAMAYDIAKNDIIDIFHGMRDLKKKTLVCVGDPDIRFAEDYSRMLRALRFACQLGFGIEKNTYSAIEKNIHHINDSVEGEFMVSRETVAKELLKSFHENPVLALDLYDECGAVQMLMPELLAMKTCMQPKNWHSEGNVWKHTRLALEKLSSKKFFSVFGHKASALTIMSALFHDIGKPDTIQTPKKDGVDRIRYTNHEKVGSIIAEKIAARLKFSSPEHIGIKTSDLSWIVRMHLLAVKPQVEIMKNTTLEKYFLNDNLPGNELIEVMWTDAQATIPHKKKPDLSAWKILVKRVDQLRRWQSKSAHKKISPLLNGNDIMNHFHLKAGKHIGKILDALREEQLSGKVQSSEDAVVFVKKFIKAERIA